MGNVGPDNQEEESMWLSRARSVRPLRHIAVVMDGNGRWAQSRGLKRSDGHRAGVESMRRCLPALLNLSIPYATLFAFSTENWRRPRDEVEFLMNLIVEWASRDRRELTERGVRLVPIGRWRDLPASSALALSRIAEETRSGRNLTVLLAVNYGGRADILDAAKKIALLAAQGQVDPQRLDEEVFQSYLSTAGYPDPDLIVRTSGEKRISNFLLWQGAYAELLFTDVYWPDFQPLDLYKAVVEYGSRKRRFGDVTTKG